MTDCVIACEGSVLSLQTRAHQYLLTSWPFSMHALKHTPLPPHLVFPPHLNIAVTAAAAADMALIFPCNECEPPLFYPCCEGFPKKWAPRPGLGGPGNWLPSPRSPSRSPSGRPQALWAQARPPISRALTGNQSPKLAENMRWGSRVDQWEAPGLWEPWCMAWLCTYTSDSHLTPAFTSIIAEL